MVVMVDGASLVSRPGQQLARGAMALGELERSALQRGALAAQTAAAEQEALQAQRRALAGQMAGDVVQGIAEQGLASQGQQIAQLFAADPTLADKALATAGIISGAQKEDAARRAFELSRIPAQEREGAILRQAEQIRSRGGDPSDTLSLLSMTPEQQNQALETVQIATLSPEKRLEVAQGTPLTNVTEAAGGGFIGLRGDEAVFVPAPAAEPSGDTVKTASQVAKEAEAAIKDDKTRFDRSSKLRSELFKNTKVFDDIQNSYSRIEAVAEAPSAAGDLALIFNFMKMLDPGSVVREGEFANAQNAAGVPTRVRSFYNRLVNGERLTETQRKDFLGQADRLNKKSMQDRQKITNRIVSIGKRFDIPEQDILGETIEPDEAETISADAQSLSDDDLKKALGL